MLNELKKGLDDINIIIWLSNVAKIHIDWNNEISIDYSDDFRVESVKDIMRGYLQQAEDIAGQVNKLTGNNNAVFNIDHVNKAMRIFAENFEKHPENQLSCTTFLASDYDIGLQQLCDFFKDGQHPSLCAIIENNETRFE